MDKNMKRWICILLLLFAIPCYAAGPEIFMIKPSSTGATCQLWQSNTVGTVKDYIFASYYTGQGTFDPGTTVQVCQVDFNVSDIVGDISAEIFTAYLFSMSGINLGTSLASKARAGSTIPVPGWYSWTFDTPISISTGTNYAFVLNGTSDTNRLLIYRSNTTTLSGTLQRWDYPGKTFNSDYTPDDINIKIYTIQ